MSSMVDAGRFLRPDGPWLQPLYDAGRSSATEGRFAVGAVLAIVGPGLKRVVLVRKARKEGFEFSGMRCLPGGLVRDRMADPAASVVASLAMRANAESGYDLGAARLSTLPMGAPPVSSYTVDGVARFTVVIPFVTECDGTFSPVASDRSISEAKWVEADRLWDDVTPASALILGHLCSLSIEVGVSPNAIQVIRHAHSQCRSWAEAVGLPPPEMPEAAR